MHFGIDDKFAETVSNRDLFVEFLQRLQHTTDVRELVIAGDFLDEVTVCYGFLKSNPMMYERCQDRRLGEEGYRKAVIKNYVLVYKINEESKIVSIMRFFYGAQDYTKLI